MQDLARKRVLARKLGISGLRVMPRANRHIRTDIGLLFVQIQIFDGHFPQLVERGQVFELKRELVAISVLLD